MRRFEMNEGTSSKFWEVTVQGKNVVVRFGRIGTDGQTKTKTAASPEAAQKEADKLVREKTAKGYAEAGAAKASKPAPKAASKAPPPTATTITEEMYERGWPHLRTLTDEAVTEAKVVAETVKGINAIDPYFPTAIPRAIAQRYLRAYVLEAFAADLKQKIAAADGPIDAAWLAHVLEKKCAPSKSRDYGGETYDFRLEEVMFLFEAFLGTEVVAAAIIGHMVNARDNLKWWGQWLDHDHQEVNRLIEVVGWMRLRMPAAKWKKLVAPLVGSESSKLPNYVAHLNALADDKVASSLDLGIQRRDEKFLRDYFAKNTRAWYYDPQFYFAAGTDLLLTVDLSKIKQLAKWHQLRVIDEMGTLRVAGAVRMIAALLPSKSAGAAAAAWIQANDSFVRASLPTIDKASAAAAMAVLDGKAAPPPVKIDRKALEKELKSIFTGIEKLLVAAKGDAKKERAVMDTAFARYTDIRAALGDVSPEAYFTHHFAEVTPKWKADEATSQRWIDHAVEAAS